MGEGIQTLDIILFAMIAAFLVLRLRSVLGKKTGHQRPPIDENPNGSKDATPKSEKAVDLNNVSNREKDVNFDQTQDPILSSALNEIKVADNSFNPNEFLVGARSAFEMIVKAFADGDLDSLRALLNDEVLEDFSIAIKDREDAGQTLDFTLIGVKEARIKDARMDGRTAFVTIQFDTEQINITRDKDANIVSGDPNRTEEVSDIWTFARNTHARDPNWILVETRTLGED
ncbi:MAG: translocase [Rhodospirillaceae bacterium]|nr:translocase [Rhodospirillaceae bacterium]|tara:strand:+ start:3781 stop:4470 length:690 start_codon:yes stop_codon:yes gene_type:complete